MLNVISFRLIQVIIMYGLYPCVFEVSIDLMLGFKFAYSRSKNVHLYELLRSETLNIIIRYSVHSVSHPN